MIGVDGVTIFSLHIRRLILILLFVIGAFMAAFANDEDEDSGVLYKYRFNADIQVRVTPCLNLKFKPEVRFNGSFDKLLLNAGAFYRTFDCIYWGASYRFIVDGVEGSDADFYHRYEFDVTYKYRFGRFIPSFMFQYSNFVDEEVESNDYFRYRAQLIYDIRKSRINPYIAFELYQQLIDGQLYKMRFATGIDLRLNIRSYLSFGYKFDLCRFNYGNANIFSAGYTYIF